MISTFIFIFLQKYLNELACNQKINIPYELFIIIISLSYKPAIGIICISVIFSMSMIFSLFFFLHLTNSNNFLLYILDVFAETTKLTISRSTEMKVPPTTENKIFLRISYTNFIRKSSTYCIHK